MAKKLTPNTWLLDAKARNAINPDGFKIPSARSLSKLDKGSIVKIYIAWGSYRDEVPSSCSDFTVDYSPFRISGERLWVIVLSRDGSNFVGEINISPHSQRLHGFKFGDKIEFHEDNILDISKMRVKV